MLLRPVRLSLALIVCLFFLISYPIKRLDLAFHAPRLKAQATHTNVASIQLNTTTKTYTTIPVAVRTKTSNFHTRLPTLKPKPTLTISLKPSPYAYVFYATSDQYACAALINIKRLHTFHTRHRVHLLASTGVSDFYLEAFRNLAVTVTIETPPPLAEGESGGYYTGCLLKLLTFRMHQIDPSVQRVLVLDSDQLILRSLDSIFELPSVDLAAPRAYWIGKDAIASTFMLITPTNRLWDTISQSMANMTAGMYDMDLVNEVLGKTVLMLPGSYVTLNSHWEDWNMPDWWRPEGEGGAERHAVEGGQGANLKELWEALGRMVEDAGAEEGRLRKRDGEEVLVVTSELKGITDEVSTPTDQELETSSVLLIASVESDLPTEEPPGGDTTIIPSTDTDIPFEDSILIEEPYKASPENPSPVIPYTPDSHPLRDPLYALYRASCVLHFTAVGKPWQYTPRQLREMKPEAHPLLYEQFETWREEAGRVCPVPEVEVGLDGVEGDGLGNGG